MSVQESLLSSACSSHGPLFCFAESIYTNQAAATTNDSSSSSNGYITPASSSIIATTTTTTTTTPMQQQQIVAFLSYQEDQGNRQSYKDFNNQFVGYVNDCDLLSIDFI
jgi:hypothetical protein